VYFSLFRFTPVPFHGFRRLILRCFGASISNSARIYPSCHIWAPWNLRMGARTTLGSHVICYNVDRVELLERSIVSQYSHLCTASHDYESVDFETVAEPIMIGPRAWVAADSFIGMGVHVGDSAIVGARAVVFRDVEPYTIVGGNPARVLKRRAGASNQAA
jgi:putative colanic acid biosynthesis acetyltransferase WcaF